MDQRIENINVGDFATIRLADGSLYWCKILTIVEDIFNECVLYTGCIISGDDTNKVLRFKTSNILAVYDFDNPPNFVDLNKDTYNTCHQVSNTEIDALKSRISTLEENLYALTRLVKTTELNR